MKYPRLKNELFDVLRSVYTETSFFVTGKERLTISLPKNFLVCLRSLFARYDVYDLMGEK